MSMKYRATSGTYNVRATEMARDKSVKTVRCIVHFLDDTETTFDIDVSTAYRIKDLFTPCENEGKNDNFLLIF